MIKKNFYTYEEAAEATRTLGFKTLEQYRKGYKVDPRLPSQPRSFYNEFTSWENFSGKVIPITIHSTSIEGLSQETGLNPKVLKRIRYRGEELRSFLQHTLNKPPSFTKLSKICGITRQNISFHYVEELAKDPNLDGFGFLLQFFRDRQPENLIKKWDSRGGIPKSQEGMDQQQLEILGFHDGWNPRLKEHPSFTREKK